MEASPIEFKLSAADLVILDHGCFYVYVVLSARRQGVYARLSVAADRIDLDATFFRYHVSVIKVRPAVAVAHSSYCLRKASNSAVIVSQKGECFWASVGHRRGQNITLAFGYAILFLYGPRLTGTTFTRRHYHRTGAGDRRCSPRSRRSPRQHVGRYRSAPSGGHRRGSRGRAFAKTIMVSRSCHLRRRGYLTFPMA
jgi:hypothetical protein